MWVDRTPWSRLGTDTEAGSELIKSSLSAITQAAGCATKDEASINKEHKFPPQIVINVQALNLMVKSMGIV